MQKWLLFNFKSIMSYNLYLIILTNFLKYTLKEFDKVAKGVMEFCLKSYLVSYFDNEINPDILNQLLVVINPRINFWQFFY